MTEDSAAAPSPPPSSPDVSIPVTAVLETSLYAEDLSAAEGFYAGLLGLGVVTRVPARHVFFRVGPAMLLVFDPRATGRPSGSALPVPAHGARGPGHVCFALDAEAIEAMAARLRGAGVAIEADFFWRNGARSIYVRDPAGNSVEFAEPRLWD